MRLNETNVQTFQVAKLFEDSTAEVNGLCFSPDGTRVIASSHDDSINVYDATAGEHQGTVYSKKYGCSLVRFTHADKTILHASTKENDTIRYLSLHDKRYIRYFVGHKAKVTGLELSPRDDTFLSSSIDGTIRLWDIRSPNCHGVIHVEGRTVAACGPQGLVFAAGLHSRQVKLYDVRQCEKGPFDVFDYSFEGGGEWTDLRFSPDGKHLLVSSAAGGVSVLDAFSGKLQHARMWACPPGAEMGSCFTPGGEYVVSATYDGTAQVWSPTTGQIKAQLPGDRATMGLVAFNPKYAMLASANSALALWIPAEDDR